MATQTVAALPARMSGHAASKSPWRTVTRTTRARRHLTEVRDAFNDTIAVVYTSEADACRFAAAPELYKAASDALLILTGAVTAPDKAATIARLSAALAKAQSATA